MPAAKYRHTPFTPTATAGQSQTNALAANERRVFLAVQYNGVTRGYLRFETPATQNGGDFNLGPGESMTWDNTHVPNGTLYLATDNGSFSVLEGSI